MDEAKNDLNNQEYLNHSLANLIENMAAGILGESPEGKIIMANQAASRILGIPRDNLTGQIFFNLNPDLIEESGKRYTPESFPSARALKTGKPVLNETIGIFDAEIKDYKWFRLNCYPECKPGESAPYLVFSTYTDISELRQKESALKEKETIFDVLFEKSPVYIFFKDQEIKSFQLSRNFEQMIGLPLESLLGKNMFELFPGDFAQKMVEDDKRILLNGETIEIEESFNGKHYTTIKFPILREDYPPFLAGFTIDITARKNAEIALQLAENRFRAIIEKASDGVVLINLENQFIYVSPSAIKLFGFKESDISTLTPDSLTHPDDLPMVLGELGRIIQNPEYSPVIQFRFQKSDGNYRWIESIFTNLLSEPGVEAIVINFRDISERKEAEEQILRLNASLEKRVAERTSELTEVINELEAFAYSISHDLRAPLRAIDGFTGILAEDYGAVLEGEGKKICGIIRNNAQKMGQLVDELLRFSRLSRTEMNHQIIDVGKLVNSVCNELITSELKKTTVVIIDELPSITGDQAMIRQVWVNLISNALKFSSKRSEQIIEISAGFDENTDAVVFTIKDNGAGFDMKYANKLFGVFQRLHTEQEFEGTGVGLAIVQRIIQRHGGKIWAESEPDKGAVFHFYTSNTEKQKPLIG